MYLQSISIKNVLSYGERPIVYYFDRHNINMITAKNGSGKCVDKSTKIDVKFQDEETHKKFMMFINKQTE